LHQVFFYFILDKFSAAPLLILVKNMDITNSEKRAVLVIVAVILISVLTQWLLPHAENLTIYNYKVQDSLFSLVSRDTMNIGGEQEKVSFSSEPDKNKLEYQSKNIAEKSSVNINTATYDDLIRLPRIGKTTAMEILKYREESGPFKNYDDLLKVKRIGTKTLETIKPFIFIEMDSLKNP
jgi:competence ComEA-like helix-hairpin-helix protein